MIVDKENGIVNGVQLKFEPPTYITEGLANQILALEMNKIHNGIRGGFSKHGWVIANHVYIASSFNGYGEALLCNLYMLHRPDDQDHISRVSTLMEMAESEPSKLELRLTYNNLGHHSNIFKPIHPFVISTMLPSN